MCRSFEPIRHALVCNRHFPLVPGFPGKGVKAAGHERRLSGGSRIGCVDRCESSPATQLFKKLLSARCRTSPTAHLQHCRRQETKRGLENYILSSSSTIAEAHPLHMRRVPSRQSWSLTQLSQGNASRIADGANSGYCRASN